jgi:hypothetical protein
VNATDSTGNSTTKTGDNCIYGCTGAVDYGTLNLTTSSDTAVGVRITNNDVTTTGTTTSLNVNPTESSNGEIYLNSNATTTSDYTAMPITLSNGVINLNNTSQTAGIVNVWGDTTNIYTANTTVNGIATNVTATTLNLNASTITATPPVISLIAYGTTTPIATIPVINLTATGTTGEINLTAPTVTITGTSSTTTITGGAITATYFNATSDYRIKENVKPLDDTFTVDNLNPVIYILKSTNQLGLGVIAHELQEEYPFMVTGEKDGKETQSVNYTYLIGILIKEVQDLKKIVSIMKTQIHDLRGAR